MTNNQVIDRIKGIAAQTLPSGSAMYLYGSRARGDAMADSDWDVLILLDKNQLKRSEADGYSFPFTDLGWDIGEDISARVFTKRWWEESPHSLFYFNVERDKKLIYES